MGAPTKLIIPQFFFPSVVFCRYQHPSVVAVAIVAVVFVVVVAVSAIVNVVVPAERYTAVDDYGAQINRTTLTQLPALAKEYVIQFQLNIRSVTAPHTADGKGSNTVFDIVDGDGVILVGMSVQQSSKYFTSPYHMVWVHTIKDHKSKGSFSFE